MTRRARYRKWLKSQAWQELAVACKHRDGYQCTKCSSKERLHAHHIRYPEDFMDTQVDDLETLCAKCHRKKHRRDKNGKSPRENGTSPKDKWTNPKAKEYLAMIRELQRKVRELEEKVEVIEETCIDRI